MKYMLLIAMVLIAAPLKAERINMCYNCRPGGPFPFRTQPAQPRTPQSPVRPVANPPRKVQP